MSRARAKLWRSTPVSAPAPAPAPNTRYTLAAANVHEATAVNSARNTILAYQTANEWPGWTGQSFARDTAVANLADLRAELLWIEANKDGSSWYRVRLQTGTAAGWQDALNSEPTTIHQGAVRLRFHNMGTGGLLIEPDAGHDPECDFQFTVSGGGYSARRVQVRGLRFVTRACKNADGTGAGRYPFGIFGTEDPPFANTQSAIPLLRIENNRFGRLFKAGETSANFRQWIVPFWIQQGEQLILRNNVFRGINGAVRGYCLKLFVWQDNDVRDFVGDVLQVQIQSSSTGWGSGAFGGDMTLYHVLRNNLVCRQAQVTNLTDPAQDISHVDYYQVSDNLGFNAAYKLMRLLEDEAVCFLDMTEKQSTFGGQTKWRTTSGSFIQDNTAEPITSVIGFNVALCGINGMNFGPPAGSTHYVMQNVIVGPPDRPLNTDNNNLLNPRVTHKVNGGTTVLRNNVLGGTTAYDGGSSGVTESGTVVKLFNVQGDFPGFFAGSYTWTTTAAGFSIEKWTLDESASKAAVTAALRNQKQPKAGGTTYGYVP